MSTEQSWYSSFMPTEEHYDTPSFDADGEYLQLFGSSEPAPSDQWIHTTTELEYQAPSTHSRPRVQRSASWTTLSKASPTASTSSNGKNTTHQCWDHGCNGRQFSCPENYRRHIREKKGVGIIACPYCFLTFSRKSNRKAHLAGGKCKALRYPEQHSRTSREESASSSTASYSAEPASLSATSSRAEPASSSTASSRAERARQLFTFSSLPLGTRQDGSIPQQLPNSTQPSTALNMWQQSANSSGHDAGQL